MSLSGKPFRRSWISQSSFEQAFPSVAEWAKDGRPDFSSMDARKEREANGGVSEYADGASELLTQQTRPESAEFVAPQQSRHSRQEGAE